jgi:uncharacterized protein YbjQ (UPF0145 family)
MKDCNLKIAALLIVTSMLSGCAAYRTSSNIDSAKYSYDGPVTITSGSLSDKEYTVISPIYVSIKKLTVFHSDPTKEQADEALKDKARIIGANAVINVKYDSGIGYFTWGYIDAEGLAVKTK